MINIKTNPGECFGKFRPGTDGAKMDFRSLFLWPTSLQFFQPEFHFFMFDISRNRLGAILNRLVV